MKRRKALKADYGNASPAQVALALHRYRPSKKPKKRPSVTADREELDELEMSAAALAKVLGVSRSTG